MTDIISDNEQAERTIRELAGHYEAIIRLLGEDVTREGLEKTPMRAAKAMYYATKGYRENLDSIVNGATFTATRKGIVVVRDIEFHSLCEHHILPFFGTMSVGYLPGAKIIGLSKLARIVDMYARRLQVQERLTAEVCECVDRLLETRGVIVSCRAQHLCMKMRGVEKQESSTVTVESCGAFDTDPSLRQEFFEAIRRDR